MPSHCTRWFIGPRFDHPGFVSFFEITIRGLGLWRPTGKQIYPGDPGTLKRIASLSPENRPFNAPKGCETSNPTLIFLKIGHIVRGMEISNTQRFASCHVNIVLDMFFLHVSWIFLETNMSAVWDKSDVTCWWAGNSKILMLAAWYVNICAIYSLYSFITVLPNKAFSKRWRDHSVFRTTVASGDNPPGGLLSAHALSGRKIFLSKAQVARVDGFTGVKPVDGLWWVI